MALWVFGFKTMKVKALWGYGFKMKIKVSGELWGSVRAVQIFGAHYLYIVNLS